LRNLVFIVKYDFSNVWYTLGARSNIHFQDNIILYLRLNGSLIV